MPFLWLTVPFSPEHNDPFKSFIFSYMALIVITFSVHKVLTSSETQTASSRIWNRLSESIFVGDNS